MGKEEVSAAAGGGGAASWQDSYGAPCFGLWELAERGDGKTVRLQIQIQIQI